MARGRKKISIESLDEKIEQQNSNASSFAGRKKCKETRRWQLL